MVNFKAMGKKETTRYLVGYGIGNVVAFLETSHVKINSDEMVEHVSELLIKYVTNLVDNERFLTPGIEHYPIVIKRDPANTKLVVGFEDEDGVWEEAPMSVPLDFPAN